MFILDDGIDQTVIQLGCLTNYIDGELANWYECETCKRVVGLHGKNSNEVLLVDFRYAFLEFLKNLPHPDGEDSILMVNRLIEINGTEKEPKTPHPFIPPVSPPMILSPMNAFESGADRENWTRRGNEDDALDLTTKTRQEESDVIDLTVSVKKKNILKRVFKRVALNNVVKRAMNIRKRSPGARAKLEFIDYSKLPLLKRSDVKEYSDLATPLPGEHVSPFRY